MFCSWLDVPVVLSNKTAEKKDQISDQKSENEYHLPKDSSFLFVVSFIINYSMIARAQLRKKLKQKNLSPNAIPHNRFLKEKLCKTKCKSQENTILCWVDILAEFKKEICGNHRTRLSLEKNIIETSLDSERRGPRFLGNPIIGGCEKKHRPCLHDRTCELLLLQLVHLL